MAVSSEMLEFSKNRFDRGLEMSKAIAQSTSLNEALDLQATFTRSIVQDYVSEAHKIVDLSTRSLLDSFSKLSRRDRKSTRLNSSHQIISYAVFCLKKKKKQKNIAPLTS